MRLFDGLRSLQSGKQMIAVNNHAKLKILSARRVFNRFPF